MQKNRGERVRALLYDNKKTKDTKENPTAKPLSV